MPGKYPFILLSLTSIHSVFSFFCAPLQSACVAVNNPSAYNKSLRCAIDVPFKAARAHCKYKIFITRLHTHSARPLGQL